MWSELLGSIWERRQREGCVDLVTDAFKDSRDEHYIQSIASLFSALSDQPELLRPIVETYLVSGSPPSTISSHSILAVLSPDDDEDEDEDESDDEDGENLFQKLGHLKSVAQKVQESIASDRPAIARPAREARDLLKELEDDSLVGVF